MRRRGQDYDPDLEDELRAERQSQRDEAEQDALGRPSRADVTLSREDVHAMGQDVALCGAPLFILPMNFAPHSAFGRGEPTRNRRWCAKCLEVWPTMQRLGPPPAGSVSTCQTCGARLSLVERHRRDDCDACAKRMGIDDEDEP